MQREARDGAATDILSRGARDAAPPAAFRLRVTRGPDAGKEATLEPSPGVALVGTGPGCDLQLTDTTVSRRHLECEIESARLRVRDLASRNGTFIQGIAIGEAYLFGGEALHIGGSCITFDRLVASPESAPVADAFGAVLGRSEAMSRLYPLLSKLARSDVSVIIEGETGTGKELVAEALHNAGPRARGPFVVFDCTAVPDSLVESELFGHERGAFTGAVGTRRGLFEAASGGTLLIDEIGDLDIHLQPKLLRVIERREVRRVGGTDVFPVDVRLLAATRRDLDAAVVQGTFRDDLFHRLAIARVELPPLRRRTGDVALLAAHFWSALGGEGALPASFGIRAETYSWPGNVRELRNAVARALALGDLDGVAPAATTVATSDVFTRVIASGLPLARARELITEEFERAYLAHALAQSGGNTTLAARHAGVAKRYFQLLRARNR